MYGDGKMRSLPSLGGTYSAAYAVNDAGLVVGTADVDRNDPDKYHPCLWQNGKAQDLGTFGGQAGIATQINNTGDIVGFADTAREQMRAFLWRRGRLTDLNTLLPANSGWELLFASGISQDGHIVGIGIVKRQVRAFLLTPAKR